MFNVYFINKWAKILYIGFITRNNWFWFWCGVTVYVCIGKCEPNRWLIVRELSSCNSKKGVFVCTQRRMREYNSINRKSMAYFTSECTRHTGHTHACTHTYLSILSWRFHFFGSIGEKTLRITWMWFGERKILVSSAYSQTTMTRRQWI